MFTKENFIKLNFKKKIVITSLLIFLISMSLLTGFTFKMVSSKFQKQVEEDGLNLAKQVSSQIISSQKATKEIDKILADKVLSISKMVIENKNISNEYLTSVGVKCNIQEINVTDKNGKIIYSNMPENINYVYPLDYSGQDILKGKKDQIIEEIRQNKVNHNYYKYCALAMPNGGLIQIGINANEIHNINKSVDPQIILEKLTKDSNIKFALIMDDKLKVTHHSDKKRLGKILKDTGSQTVIDTGKNYTSAYDYNGEEVYDIIMPLKDENGKLLGAMDIGISLATQETALRNILITSILITLITFVLAGLAIFYIIKVSLKPLDNLSNVAKKVSKGNLTEKVEIVNEDEIGELSKIFNTMIDSLREITRNINNFSIQLAGSSQEILSSAEQTSAVSQEISSATEEIASGAENQVKASNESSLLMNDVMGNMYTLKEEFDEIISFSNNTNTLASKGQENMSNMVQQMATIKNSVVNSSNIMYDLQKNSEEIGNIVEIINTIADQTNLLALNASIEAARAGEAGKGFAVVADEVRKLAEESINSANNIKNLIVNTQDKTKTALNSIKDGASQSEKGESIVAEVKESLGEILNSFSSVNHKFASVDSMITASNDSITAMASKLYDIETISNTASANTEEVAASTEEQSATIEEITESIEKLVSMVENLKESVSIFKL
ncbi:methyl-accepting chemotaxis protein [Clostridium botulinum]|uniref:HAMP domain-containing protein n=1 Tax=Clostridium botulinum TaxID=1491 RepID=A0ABD7CPG7_CLOBO|nr:methyl-accepting chemotaxis protein [Clostridium botulinum]KGO15389.1 chemotaxis protein [Clostridium botulinum]KIN82170.1 chemotaxis protein [Clostridium botulinum]QRI55297.1 HAMP domain-containing protein [Clostridium botulinum]